MVAISPRLSGLADLLLGAVSRLLILFIAPVACVSIGVARLLLGDAGPALPLALIGAAAVASLYGYLPDAVGAVAAAVLFFGVLFSPFAYLDLTSDEGEAPSCGRLLRAAFKGK